MEVQSQPKNSENGKSNEDTNTHPDIIKPYLKDYCPASNLAFNEKVRQMIADGQKVYHLAFGQSPFPVPEGAVKELKQHADENLYLPVQGLLKLRTTICDFHAKLDGLTHFTPDNVIAGPGSKELIYLLLAVYNGDVMVLSPSWTTYKPQTLLAGLKAIILQTKQEDDWRLTPDILEQVILENKLGPNRLLIMCNPDNPTGTSYTAEHLKALSEVFRKHKVIVLSDEIYSRTHFEDNHASLAKFYPEGCILSTGLSKWASAGGWRFGYHIYPSELSVLKQAVCSAASHTYSCAAAPVQHAAIWLHEWSEEVKDYVVHERRILQAAARFCHRELTSVGVKAVMPTAGYYMFPNFEILRPALKARGITTGTQCVDAIFNEAHVALMSGGPAFQRPVEEFTVRLCFINFDGTNALKGSRKADPKVPLGDEFLKEYCPQLVEAILSLKKWVLLQLENGTA